MAYAFWNNIYLRNLHPKSFYKPSLLKYTIKETSHVTSMCFFLPSQKEVIRICLRPLGFDAYLYSLYSMYLLVPHY